MNDLMEAQTKAAAPHEKRSRFRELRVLWLALLLVLVLDVGLPPLVGAQTSSLDPLIRFGTQSNPHQVLLLGSSRTRFLSKEVLESTKPAFAIQNLSFNGGSLEAMTELSRRFLPPEILDAKGVRLLVLAVGPMDVNDARSNPIVVETWSFVDALKDMVENGLTARTRTFLRRKTPLKHSRILEYLRRGQLKSQLKDFALSMSGRMGLTESRNSTEQPSSAELNETVQSRNISSAKRLAEVPPPTNPSTLRNFSVGDSQFNALRELVLYMRAANVQVVLVHTPVSDWFAQTYSDSIWRQYLFFLAKVRDELKLPVILLGRSAYNLSDDDYFRQGGGFDGHHVLSDTGKASFARGLLRHVVNPFYRRITDGKPVSDNQSRFEVPRK